MVTMRKLDFLLPFLMLLLSSECNKKAKRTRANSFHVPQYHLYHYDNLIPDQQITIFLHKGRTQTFSYYSKKENYALSVTVSTCSSPVRWGIRYLDGEDIRQEEHEDIITKDMYTTYIVSEKGRYNLHFTTTLNDSLVNIYISTEDAGPSAIINGQNQKLKTITQKRKLLVKWKQSKVDPHVTTYCLVVNTKEPYKSLCRAESEKYGLLSPQEIKRLSSDIYANALRKHKTLEKELIHEPVIECVGKKNLATLNNLVTGQRYYLDLFATDRKTNLTYPFGSEEITFTKRVKPTFLKDGKIVHTDLRKSNGKVTYRYKVKQKAGENLYITVLPCGGAVDVQVNHKDEILTTERKIIGVENITVPVVRGQSYLIKIFASNMEELGRMTGVKVFVSTKTSRNPLLIMPKNKKIEVLESTRKCNSFIIAWNPVILSHKVRYCILIEEGQFGETKHRMPNQCRLEKRLKKSADHSIEYCAHYKANNSSLTQKITELKPGTSYIIQIVVKKPKLMMLSYDLLEVHTKPKCM